jgi:pimeloyl-ACP methyl ester carboxylesterase
LVKACLSIAVALALTACIPLPSPRPITQTPSGSESPVPSVTPSPTSSDDGPGPIDRPSYPPSDAKPEGFVDAPGTDLEAYLAQQLDWEECGSGFECTTVVAPLDYDAPGEQAITLAVKRRPATDEPRIGSLFINPGGPGSSGVEYAEHFDPEGLERYDIVGWDPRGVDGSTPVKCYSDAEADALNQLDFSPDDEAERDELIAGYTALGKACWDNSGVLLEHISTVETAKDLDLLRQLLGDEKLHFYGASYGTYIGAVYAELFGANVERMVMDSAMDITDDEEIIQAMGFDTALSHFAAWCAGIECELGSTEQEVISTLDKWLMELDADPVRVSTRSLTQSLATSGIGLYLYYGEDGWSDLLAAVSLAMDGEGQYLLAAGDYLSGRDDDGHYGSLFYSFNSIVCLDESDDGLDDADAEWAKDQEKAPFFAKFFGPGYLCPVWPVQPVPELKITAPDAPPIVVVGSTGDNATPYQQAVDTAGQLTSGILVTFDGEGHASYRSSDCIADIVTGYLVDGTVPEDGVVCT